MKKEQKDGVYAKCETCQNPIYEHMKDNKAIYDDTEMCGACATGESATYIDEI